MDSYEDSFASNLHVKTLEERSRERMEKRQEKLRRLSSDENDEMIARTYSRVRYLSMKVPKIVKYDSEESLVSDKTDDSADSGLQVLSSALPDSCSALYPRLWCTMTSARDSSRLVTRRG